jgi:hypothetical protein
VPDRLRDLGPQLRLGRAPDGRRVFCQSAVHVRGDAQRDPRRFFVARNSVRVAEGGYGITSYTSKGAAIAGNRVTGRGEWGIGLGPDFLGGAPTEGAQVLLNDVEAVRASVAPIFLGPYSTSCRVVGHDTAATVLDQGTANVVLELPGAH